MHTTTTTTQVNSSVATQNSTIRLQMTYVVSFSGILLLASLVIDIVIAICGGATPYLRYFSQGKFIIFVGVFFLIINGVLYALHAFNVQSQLNTAPWTIIDLIVLSVSLLFHFIAFCVACANVYLTDWYAGLGATAFFTIVNCILYGILIFLIGRQIHTSGFFIRTSTTMTTNTNVDGGVDAKPTDVAPPAYYPSTTGTSATYSQY